MLSAPCAAATTSHLSEMTNQARRMIDVYGSIACGLTRRGLGEARARDVELRELWAGEGAVERLAERLSEVL